MIFDSSHWSIYQGSQRNMMVEHSVAPSLMQSSISVRPFVSRANFGKQLWITQGNSLS